jgi:hypothetical protein
VKFTEISVGPWRAAGQDSRMADDLPDFAGLAEECVNLVRVYGGRSGSAQ